MWRQVIAPNSGNAVPVTDNLNIAPAVSNRPPASCPGAPPFRLQVGQSGRVTPGDANNLRAQGASNAQIVGTLRGGDTFAVVGGPTCSGGMTYWQVNHNGQVGWTAEGTNTSYWLEPTN
jgi:hypothetical protein